MPDTTYKSIAKMEGGSIMNSQFGGGSFGTLSSGMRGTGAVDFSIVCNSQCIILCTLPCLYIRNICADITIGLGW